MANQAISLVFTDVVGSSAAKRDQDLGSTVSLRDRAYLEAIQGKHLRVVRSAVAEHKGKEIMTIGDSFFLTFDEPLDALRCCAAIHQRLKDQPIDTLHGPLRLRIGLHVGMPEYFEGSWHGTDVDTAARVQSVGSAGQIVVSHAARQLLGEPIGIKFRPLGRYALKGVVNVKLWDADYDYHGLRNVTIKSIEQKRRSRIIGSTIAAIVLLPLLAFAGYSFWKQHEQAAAQAAAADAPQGAPSSIIVADFENKTGEPIFDAILPQAFNIQLQQSPVITVASPQHLRESLKFLGKSPDEPLTPATAQEIGVREGDKAYVTGNIAKLEDTYLITASAINPLNGDTIATAQAQATTKDKVLDALSAVSTQMRTKLGESLDSIEKLDTPLGQATTPSLEAFRAYALGDVDHLQGKDVPDAEGHYLQALAIDPKFATAWARLGAVYSNVGQDARSIECFKKAFDLSANISERERFTIDGFYYGDVTGNIQKMIDTLTLAVRTYPKEADYYINLGIALYQIGRIEDALAISQKALALSPGSAIAHTNVMNALISLDRFQEAQAVGAEVLKMGLNDTSDRTNFYSLHAFTGDTAAMAQDLAAVQGRPDESNMIADTAIMEEYFGQYAAAERSWRRCEDLSAQQKATDSEAFARLNRVSGRLIAGLPVDTVAEVKSALALDQSRLTLLSAAEAYALANLPAPAQAIIDQMVHDYPEDTLINQIWGPVSHAQLALNAHNPKGALQALDGYEAYGLVCSSDYVRGCAFLELKDGPHAVEAFLKATRYRGAAVQTFHQDYGQAQLGLARAHLLTGDTAAAKKSYEALFETWQNADADLPQLVAAKNEYAALK
jgi:class 3 adenylate cyclase/tetratricopeptide (TPR) repeat protein